jgi:hypothetical protein
LIIQIANARHAYYAAEQVTTVNRCQCTAETARGRT